MSEPPAATTFPSNTDQVLRTVEDVCERYEITALEDFVASCRAFAKDDLLNVAIVGRFKAGKSSFLNFLLQLPLLPVGVVPVTSAVTEIQYGATQRAEVRFVDGHSEQLDVDSIGQFIAESENPENRKGVARVRVELPSMERYRGIRFVDTPGLDSVFAHNTDASLDWLPNVGMALVAVGVDPPLSEQDVGLIRKLQRYTPNIGLLLTKVDVLDGDERIEVQSFVRQQLSRFWNGSVPVYPFSIRPGFEKLRDELDRNLLSNVHRDAGQESATILRHKVASLLRECADYLSVALKAAEVADSERDDLRRKILGEKQSLEDTRLALRLIARHAASRSRADFEALVQREETPTRKLLLDEMQEEFPRWTRSLNVALESFDSWLGETLNREMSGVSSRHREEFIEPVSHVGKQLSQALQDFRNRLSERMLETLGVPLRTTEVELNTQEPRTPDVRVGKIFDRNWELLSAVVPMAVFRSTVKHHFEGKVGEAVFVNLSRLVSQWSDAVTASLALLEKDAGRRLDGLVATIERLIAAAGQEAPRIRDDLEELSHLRDIVLEGAASPQNQ